ncbi:MAG: CBS domain-containing protein [Thermoplasmatota archaeon]|jgi:CBS domain-containing protein
MLVEEIMSTDFVTIDCDKTIYDACKLYSEKKVDHLIVMDKDILVGIVTDRDIIEGAILKNKSLKKTKISEIMTTNLKTINALTNIEKAAEIMKENKIKKLPVILNDKIIGIIKETDLLEKVNIFSETFKDLSNFYEEKKKNLEEIIKEWKDIINDLDLKKVKIFKKILRLIRY